MAARQPAAGPRAPAPGRHRWRHEPASRAGVRDGRVPAHRPWPVSALHAGRGAV